MEESTKTNVNLQHEGSYNPGFAETYLFMLTTGLCIRLLFSFKKETIKWESMVNDWSLIFWHHCSFLTPEVRSRNVSEERAKHSPVNVSWLV